MNLDMNIMPFSRFGSFLTISKIKDDFYIRTVRGGDFHLSKLFKIEILDFNNNKLTYEVEARPNLISFNCISGKVEFCIDGKSLLRFRGKGVILRLIACLESYDTFISMGSYYELNSYREGIRMGLKSLRGDINIETEWKVIGSTKADIYFNTSCDKFEGVIEEYIVSPQYINDDSFNDFDGVTYEIEEEFNNWLSNSLKGVKEFEGGREQAAYITWNTVVPSEGKLTRKAMYMSKNWMTNIWAWDNCFNALALSYWNMEMALDQIKIFFDNQHSTGMLPDFINNNICYYNSTKPPIYGWILRIMMNLNKDYFTLERLKQIYYPLKRVTEWWLEHRDCNKDGIAQYNHGNDSGWDNSTVFNYGVPVDSPDLSAFLVLQMEVLYEIALQLNLKEDFYWKDKAKELLEKMIAYFWDGSEFKAKATLTGENIDSKSLLTYIPLILGERLPKNIREKLIKDIKYDKKFITENGFATEEIDSSFYKEDGYWRGAIWAPSTFIMVKALEACGEKQLAIDISKKFCTMAQRSGMAENFGALTGEGLRDRAFTWTSSVYLLLNNYCI